MVRREVEGSWYLIRQIDHARLSGGLAELWGNGSIAELPWRPALIDAIAQHDDGWVEWDSKPEIDVETGKPRSFTEMQMETATAIWSRSIERAAANHAWAGVWVAEHFLVLDAYARESHEDDPAEMAALRAFSERERANQQRRMDEAASPDADRSVEDVRDVGWRWVRFFDYVSLWLCCTPHERELELETVAADRLRFVRERDFRVTVDPFPFAEAEVVLTAPASVMAASRFESDTAFQAEFARSEVRTLRWHLTAVD